MNAISPEPSLAQILVVDDDQGIRTLVAGFLERNGCHVKTAADTREMDAHLADGQIDLIVLDLMMPGEDGLSALKRLQATGTSPAIIMLSAVGTDVDRIIGLEVGADDYLAKPCNPRELLARIRVLHRNRQRRRESTPSTPNLLTFGGWRVDIVSRTVLSPDEREIYLTDGEFALLHALAQRPLNVLSRDELLTAARGANCESFDRAIDVQVSRLRRKLGSPDLIRTIRSEGYMLVTKRSTHQAHSPA